MAYIAEVPVFEKYPRPIFTRNQAEWVMKTNGQIYFPSVIYVGDFENRKYSEPWYMYYSTDHASGPGGIGLATAPGPEGPWFDRGMIFQDTTAGEQTETPEAFVNKQTGKIHLYYSQNYYESGDTAIYPSQATCLALSNNGVDFTVEKAPLIVPGLQTGEFPGDGHTGYARVYRLGNKWVMRHSMGGTSYSHKGVSYSDDGINWQTDPRPIIGDADWSLDGVARQIGVNGVFSWKGQLWANVNDNGWTSGTGESSAKIYISPFVDPRFPGYGLHEILEMGGPGSFDQTTIRNISFVEKDGALYLFYEGVSAKGDNAFGMAKAGHSYLTELKSVTTNLKRDNHNNIVPLGRVVERKVECNFIAETALPSWITTSVGGTASAVAVADLLTGTGGVRLTAGPLQNDYCYLKLTNGVGFQYFEEIIMDIEGFVMGSINSTVRFELLNAAGTKGIVVFDDSQFTKIEAHATGGNTVIQTNYKMVGNNEYNRRRNIRIRLRSDGTVAVGEHSGDMEHYFAVHKFSPTELELNDVLLPKIGIVARNAGTLTMRIPRVALKLIHN